MHSQKMLSWRKPGFVYFFRLFFRRSPQPPQELLSDPVDIFLKSTRGQDGANLHHSTSLLCTKLSNAELQTFVLRGFINFTAPQLSLPPSAPLKNAALHTHRITPVMPQRAEAAPQTHTQINTAEPKTYQTFHSGEEALCLSAGCSCSYLGLTP